MFYVFIVYSITAEVWAGRMDKTELVYGNIVNRNVILGLLLYIVGSFEQHRAHKTLASLRKKPADTVYGIPKGGLFNYVWSPHYLGEILIYISFLVVSGGQLISLWLITTFVIITLANQAWSTKQWYLKRADVRNNTQLKARYALVPYIF